MLTIETEANIGPDGVLVAQAPAHAPKGRHRVVIVMDAAEQPPADAAFPDLAGFRAALSGRPYPGTAVVDYRDEER